MQIVVVYNGNMCGCKRVEVGGIEGRQLGRSHYQ